MPVNSEKIDVLKFPHTASQSFLSVFPYLSVETMATAESSRTLNPNFYPALRAMTGRKRDRTCDKIPAIPA
jgi:hypothetical protein